MVNVDDREVAKILSRIVTAREREWEVVTRDWRVGRGERRKVEVEADCCWGEMIFVRCVCVSVCLVWWGGRGKRVGLAVAVN